MGNRESKGSKLRKAVDHVIAVFVEGVRNDTIPTT